MQTVQPITRIMRPGFFSRSISTARPLRSAWTPGPAPPRLPKEEQEIFEKLQQESTGAFSTPANVRNEQTAPGGEGAASTELPTTEQMLERLRERARLAAKGDGEELHPNVRRGAPPEFEGDTNPKTGEVGGPKNEPVRWGPGGDWSYNGRVTDF